MLATTILIPTDKGGEPESMNRNLSNNPVIQKSGPPSSNCIAIANTAGSMDTFLTVDLPIQNKKVPLHPIIICNPNGSTMTSTHTTETLLPPHFLPPRDGPTSSLNYIPFPDIHWNIM